MRLSILILAFATALFLPAAPPLANAGSPLCNTASDSWSPRTGATVSITATACGTLDSSTNLFKSSSNSVSSSTTDANIIALSGNYTYLGFCSTISHCKPGDAYTYLVEQSTGAGVYPNNSKSFNAGQAKCIETNPFDLQVKDSITGLVHTLTATAVQGAPGQICQV